MNFRNILFFSLLPLGLDVCQQGDGQRLLVMADDIMIRDTWAICPSEHI